MPSWAQKAYEFLKQLPVAQYIKPVWKWLLQQAVQQGGDALQQECNALLDQKGDAALAEIQGKVDQLQSRIDRDIDALPLPASWEARIKKAIDEPVDALQLRLAQACEGQSAAVARSLMNAAFDRFQDKLKASIRAL